MNPAAIAFIDDLEKQAQHADELAAKWRNLLVEYRQREEDWAAAIQKQGIIAKEARDLIELLKTDPAYH
jgi:hypothetical protein